MRSVLLCAALAVVFLPADAVAQSRSLTEAEALARLSPESPRVRAITAAVGAARADVLVANRWPNPTVSFDRESVAGITEHMTTVTQALPITGRRGLETQAASMLVDAAERRADASIRRARADLRLAFADLASAQARQRELAAARDHLRELVAALARRENAGDVAGFDRLRAERELADVDVDLAAAQVDRGRAQSLLASFFAGPVLDTDFVVELSPPSRGALPDLEALLQRAESTRGDLQALSREVDAARISVRAADPRRRLEPELVGGTKTSTVGGGDAGGVLAVRVTVPLFDRHSADRAVAEARANLAAARADALRSSIRTEVAALRAAVLSRREAADAYRARAVTGAADIERIAQVSYDAGDRSILELLDAYRTSAAARVRQAALDAASRQAEVELEYASGWEMP